jgi:tetratricopeptide (TPR) repeat protein
MGKGIVRSGLALTLAVVFLTAGLVTVASARAQQAQQQKPAYTYAEYNAYQAAAKETVAQQRIKLLDEFVSKFPKSTLLPYVYQAYFQTYDQLKQYDKVIEYADKLIEADGKEVDSGKKLQAIYAREVAFNFAFSDKAPDAAEQAQTARKYASMGLQLLGELPKPTNMTDEQFAQQKKGPASLFNYTEGFAALFLKDYPGAEKAFHAALTTDPKNAVTYFRLGLAYLQQASQVAAAAPPPQAAPATPPAATAPPAEPGAAPAAAQGTAIPPASPGQSLYMHGFWALARSVALKGSTEQQVRAYLQNQMLVYQKTACQDLLTAQMNQLLQMAATTETIDPPADYAIPSGVQLGTYLQDSNLFTIMQDLQAGGDKAKFVWLAVCGNEFPEVPVKVIAVTPADTGVDMQVYSGSTPQDIQKATTANMDVKVEDQPDAQRLVKDNIVRFTGTLASYDPAPSFMLHWDKAKVNPADIPSAKPGARKKPGARRR